MPEQFVENLKKKIKPTWKVCFWVALVLGLVTHLYKVTNWLPNWDSLLFRYDAQDMLAIGRWFLPVVCAPSSFYDLPWLTGLVAILFHALGAVCILEIFRVKKHVTAALIGGLVVTFPTVTSVMLYNYVADGYSISFFFACLAAWCLTKEKPNYILSVILIALSSGIYQAYITVTITLLLCHLMLEAIASRDVHKLLIKSVKCLFAGALGMALYYGIMTVALKITGKTMLAYQGFDSAMSLSSIDLWSALYVMKHTLTDYFFDFSMGISTFAVINCIVLGLTVILYVIYIITEKIKLSGILFFGVCAMLLPVGACVFAIINSQIDYHNLMKMGYLVFYLLFVLLYERAPIGNRRLSGTPYWAIFIMTMVLIFNQAVIANVCYHNAQLAYEKSYGVLMRIADRIEQTDGAADCTGLLVIGALKDSEAYSVNLPPDMTGTTDGYILRANDEVVAQSVLCSALNDYCGKNYTFLMGEDRERFTRKNNTSALGIWPEKNAIAVMDNVIVIKLGTESAGAE